MNELLKSNQMLKVFCIAAAAKVSNRGSELIATAEYLFKWLLDEDGSSCNDDVSIDEEGKTVS